MTLTLNLRETGRIPRQTNGCGTLPPDFAPRWTAIQSVRRANEPSESLNRPAGLARGHSGRPRAKRGFKNWIGGFCIV